MEVDSSLKDEKYFSLNDNKFISSFVFLFSTLHFFLMHQSINQLIYLSKFSGCLALPVKLVSMRPTCSSQGPTTTMTRTMARRPSPASTECCWSPPPPAPPRPIGSRPRRSCVGGLRGTLCGKKDAALPPSGRPLGAPSRPLPLSNLQ